jgi:uncharacterized protein YndB with AHSA1/START domain
VARNEIHIDAPVHAVWDVLADPRFYANWVVGASSVRDVEDDWPAAGSTLHHTQQLVLRDSTQVTSADPPHRLVLEARARPIVIAEVDIRLEPKDGGTHLVMFEHARSGIAGALPAIAVDPLIHVRNIVAVARLKRLAEIGVDLGRVRA